MMKKHEHNEADLFIYNFNLEKRIPSDHPLSGKAKGQVYKLTGLECGGASKKDIDTATERTEFSEKSL